MIRATYLRHMGTDLDVVNNARVSFLKTSRWDEFTNELTEGDKRLVQFLARGMPEKDLEAIVNEVSLSDWDTAKAAMLRFRNTPTHWAPFANGIRITFHVVAPIPIMRQLFKHKVGAEESEVSRRYVDDEPEFFYPEWREAAPNVKQGSAGPHEMLVEAWDDLDGTTGTLDMDRAYSDLLESARGLYATMIREGVCPEQARFVLPQAAMTEAIVSHSLYGWANVYNQRTDPHAQKEIGDLARDVARQVAPLFPVSWPALTGALD